MIDEKDYQEIKERLKKDLKKDFVPVEDCDKTTSETDKRLNNHDTSIVVIQGWLKFVLAVLTFMGGLIGTFVFNAMLKG